MSDSVVPDPTDELAQYKKIFLQHVSFTRAHSNGDGEKPLISSIQPPNAFWTVQEKNRFFYGLSRYSKLRPDLIAEFVGSGKTTTDVIGYMAALEEGSKREGSPKGKEKPHPAARAVSGKWIKFEEKLASRLIAQEIEWQVERQEMERERERKKRTRVKQDHDNEEEDLEWRRENTIKYLGRHELMTLDSIIRKEIEQTATGSALMQQDIESTQEPSSNPNGRGKSESPPNLDLSTMTPAERRRVQKRLHMRRKRAEAAGLEVVLAEGRLKPGRKTTRPQVLDRTTRSSANPALLPSSPDDEEEINRSDEADEDEDERRYKARGLTRPQKVQQSFNELGIDISFIQNEGMDLFNLSRFITLGSLLSDDRKIEFISHLTLRLLRGYVEEFLYEVLGKLITLAETERALKDATKVWHEPRSEVKTSHVSEALALMGMSRLETKSFGLHEREAELVGHLRSAADPEALGAIPIHNSVYPPLIAHEGLLETPDILMEDDIIFREDQEGEKAARMAELAEDLRQEVMDEKVDERHEKALWKSMGLGDTGVQRKGEAATDFAEEEKRDQEESTGESSDEEPMSRTQWHNPLRLRPIGGAVKSQPFIFSDDEEEDGAEMEMG